MRVLCNPQQETPTLTTGGDNTDTTFSGAITDAISVVKEGTGTQILSGTNTYTGTTTVNVGTLELQNVLPWRITMR